MIRDIIAELVAMFVADGPLAAAILAVVALAAALARIVGAPPLVGGATLLFGCLALLAWTIRRNARM
jgi:hypothetical protein